MRIIIENSQTNME